MNYEINLQSLIKLLMHSLKYPYAKINGLLLSKKSNDNKIKFVDYIPLFHYNQGLTAMLEIALIQTTAYCKKNNLQISGYFQANSDFHDESIDIFAQKIGEKLIESNSSSAILILNSQKLADCMSKEEKVEEILDLYNYVKNEWKSNSFTITEDDKIVLEFIKNFLFKQQKHSLINDFDSHLRDVNCDWFNKDLNDLIKESLKSFII